MENIGYVIPTPVILHFINDYEKSSEYTGIFQSVIKILVLCAGILFFFFAGFFYKNFMFR